MIHSAVIRLSLYYLALIMAMSIGFSIILYNIAGHEIIRSWQQQEAYYTQLHLPSLVVEDFRRQQLQENMRHMRVNLALLNVGVLLLGGAAGYLLARRTLRPIALALEAQSRFAADASHELRTPLTAMQTENEVALRNPSLTKEQAKELLTSNLEEVAKLRALSEGLLRLAQADSKDLPMKRIKVKALLSEANQRVQKSAQAKDITIETEPHASVIHGDFESLVDLLVILLDNAIKYSDEGSKVQFAARRTSRSIIMSVSDSGNGIPAADLPRIFERFYRSDSSRTRQTGGYGLGLSIAAKIAHLHGGRIDAVSEVGKGSVFTLYLPLKRIDTRATA